MSYQIVFDKDQCVGCNACAIACIDQNDIDVTKGEQTFINVSMEEELTQGVLKLKYVPKSCMHCSDAPCAEACPMNCIELDKESGFVIYDDSNCIGCKLCAKACPYEAISFSRDEKIRKCDGCYIRVKCEMEPACVRNCFTKALRLNFK